MRARWRTRVLCVAVLVTACGAPLANPVSKVIRVVLADDWAVTAPVLEAVRMFELANPGVRVDVEGVPFASIGDTVAAAILAGDPPALAQWHAFAAGARGLAEPVDDLWAAHLDDDDFLPGAIEDVEWAGVRYGVPLDTNALILLGNAHLLAAAGVGEDDLRTHADLLSAAALLGEPFGRQRAFALSLSSWAAYGWIRTNGGELVELADDGTPTFLLDSPRVVAAMDFLGGLVTAGLAHEPSLRNRSIGMVNLFLAGEAALVMTGSWDLVAANAEAGQDVPGIVALPLPRGSDELAPGTVLGGSSVFVPVGSPERELGFAFALALIDDQTALELAKQEGRLPVRRSAFEDPWFDGPAVRVVRDQLDVASPMKLLAFPTAQIAFTQALEEILRGERSAVDALGDAQRLAVASVAGPT